MFVSIMKKVAIAGTIAKGRRLKAESVYLNCIDTAILTFWSVVLGRYYE